METGETVKLISEMKDWAKRLSENQMPKYPDRIQMRSFLEECGADFSAIKGHEDSMKKWTDKGMSNALNAVWGKKFEDIKDWNEEFIKDYEEKTGHILPSIPVYKKGTKEVVRRSKQSSMKHVLGIMTRWACFNEDEDFEFNEKRFREEIEVRISNGLLRLQGINSMEDLLSIERPDTKEVYHPSLPPNYPIALVDYLLKN